MVQQTLLEAYRFQYILSGAGHPHFASTLAGLTTDEQLERVHPREYVRAIREVAPSEGTVHLDPDTAMNRYTLRAALRAAGAGACSPRIEASTLLCACGSVVGA